MSRFATRIDRALAWLHRWAGIVLCLMFVAWFVSGAVLHFVGFPSLPGAERWAHAEALDLARVGISPAAALKTAALSDAQDVRLVSVADQPVYLVTAPARTVAISAETGSPLPLLTSVTARAIAEHFAGIGAQDVAGPLDYDQWIVHQQFDRVRPFFRIRLDDEARTDLYVSARTGEVLQRTRARERAWNWCGAVLHWIYFTPVREHWSLWDRLVWWVSLAALLTSAIGVWLGVIRTIAMRRLNRTRWTPFKGWIRWHHLIGLVASVIVIGWMMSGWLSMDHGRLFSPGDLASHRASAVRGMSVEAMVAAAGIEQIRSAAPAAEISLQAVASRAFLSVRGVDGVRRIDWLDSGTRTAGAIPEELLVSALKRSWRHVAVLNTDSSIDRLYRLAEGLPQDALAADVRAGTGTDRAYVDRATGRLLVVMDSSRRAYAWIYYGLHTLNFPGLNTHPALRTALIVTLVSIGLAFSVTGVIVGVRRLRLQFR